MSISLKQEMAKTESWVLSMRQALRDQNGEGWTCRDIRSRTQISVRFEDGQRTTLVLDLPWQRSSMASVLRLAERLKKQMAKGMGLREAYELCSKNDGATGNDGGFDWGAVVQAFEKRKVGTGAVKSSTFKQEYQPVMRQVLAALEAKPKPINARTLLDRMANHRMRNGQIAAPGSEGRKRRIQRTAQLLEFAREELAAEDRWAPPSDLTPYIGVKPKGRELTTFIRDDQLVRLLDGIKNRKWRNAVALVACFGLRGVELAHLTPNQGFLHCSYRKRTERNPEGTPPRDIVGLDPVGLEGLSANLLAILEEQGNEALPDTCFLRDSDGELVRAGHALSQYLRRNATWQELVDEVAATPAQGRAGTNLVAYSLRHAYAARAHEVFSFSPRKAAGLMGHSLLTHSLTYGSQIDQEILDTAKEQAAEVVAARLAAV